MSSKRKNRPRNRNRSSTTSQSSTSKSPANSKVQPQKKERGWLLTLFLILIIGSGILEAVLYIVQRRQDSVLQAPVLLALAILHAVLNVIAGIGVWYWKKWGVYLYVASSVLGVIIGVIAVGPIAFFSVLLPVIILGYLIAAKWSWFE